MDLPQLSQQGQQHVSTVLTPLKLLKMASVQTVLLEKLILRKSCVNHVHPAKKLYIKNVQNVKLESSLTLLKNITAKIVQLVTTRQQKVQNVL